MTKPTKRRFIAGAVCPECQAVDRLVLQNEESGLTRHCVNCGFTDHQVQISSGGIPKGKRDKSAQSGGNANEKNSEEISPVRIINPSQGTESR